MKTFSFKVELASTYIFNLTSKITVVLGDSARGKSAFIKQLTEVQEWRDRYPFIEVIRNIDDVALIDYALNKVSPERVLVLDEDSIRLLRRHGRTRRLNKLNCNILIFCRDSMFDIMYSYVDVYVPVYTDNVITLKRAFPDYTQLPKDSMYFTEDSGSGLEYYARQLGSCVTPAGDNVKFKDCAHKGTIIADGAILGPLVTQWYAAKLKFSLFAPVSFEYLIERYFDSYYKSDFMDRVPLSIKSLERFFTALVKRRFTDYNKSHCPAEVIGVDLLVDFRENDNMCSVFKQYCAKYGITNTNAERERLSKIYGTTDFDSYLKTDFGL